MNLGLAGCCAIVTGGSRGIGRAIVEEFVREGCYVFTCGRTASDLEGLQRALGDAVRSCVVDVRDAEAVREWIAGCAEGNATLAALVLNVSAQSHDLDECFAVDLRSTMQTIDAVLPWLERSPSPAIVAIASQAASLAVPSYAAYSAVKAGLISSMGSLARGLAPKGIRVNSVSPSAVDFPGGFWDRMRIEDPVLVSGTLSQLGAGRFCEPDEVARAVVFLASPAASYISGANLLVDFAGRAHVQF